VPTVLLKGVRPISTEVDDGHLDCELAGDSSSTSCASDSNESDDKSDKAEIDGDDSDKDDSEEECEGVFEVPPDPMEEEILASLKAVEKKLELLAEKIDPTAAENMEQEAAPPALCTPEGAPLQEAADCITRIMDEIVKLEVGDVRVYTCYFYRF
jgi:hypothetical protein